RLQPGIGRAHRALHACRAIHPGIRRGADGRAVATTATAATQPDVDGAGADAAHARTHLHGVTTGAATTTHGLQHDAAGTSASSRDGARLRACLDHTCITTIATAAADAHADRTRSDATACQCDI